MFGRFLEIGLATAQITASVPFYERLGFSQLVTTDAWPHRYGVINDARLYLGLHERKMPSPAITFVLPEVARSLPALLAAGIEPESTEFGEAGLHHAWLRDPGGQAVLLLEARTFSPAAAGNAGPSLCGYFSHLSLPQRDFERAREFWERAGFVSLAEQDEPFPHLPLTSDHLELAFHQRRTFDAPMLVFECEDVSATRERLRALEFELSDDLPRGLDPSHYALLESPEGAAILLGPGET
jgi:hypothetical protein